MLQSIQHHRHHRVPPSWIASDALHRESKPSPTPHESSLDVPDVVRSAVPRESRWPQAAETRWRRRRSQRSATRTPSKYLALEKYLSLSCSLTGKQARNYRASERSRCVVVVVVVFLSFRHLQDVGVTHQPANQRERARQRERSSAVPRRPRVIVTRAPTRCPTCQPPLARHSPRCPPRLTPLPAPPLIVHLPAPPLVVHHHSVALIDQ